MSEKPKKKITPELVLSVNKLVAAKLPSLPAPCGDLLYQIRDTRHALQKFVELLEKRESSIKEFLINKLPKGKSSGVRGKIAYVEINTKAIPAVKDWPKLYAYIKKNDAFELLQKRVTESAVEERWENGTDVPGVEKFNVVKVSCTKA